jgi:hypothetical protein
MGAIAGWTIELWRRVDSNYRQSDYEPLAHGRELVAARTTICSVLGLGTLPPLVVEQNDRSPALR